MTIIFAFSEQPGSGSLWEPPFWYVFERKLAHVVEYAILCVLTGITFRYWFPQASRNCLLSAAVLFTAVYGISDEIHQAFIFGRGSRFTDVLIDTSGAILGILIYSLFGRWERKDRK